MVAETPLSSKPHNSIDAMDLGRQLESKSSSHSLDRSSTYNSTIPSGSSTAFSSPVPSFPGNSLRCDPSIVEIGADETLWNPDKTRYGGILLPPKEYLELALTGRREDRMKSFREYMRKREERLTPAEQAQNERWLRAATGSCDCSNSFDQDY